MRDVSDTVTAPRVLVVDDAGSWVPGILTVLRRQGVPVAVVSEGADTVDLTHRIRPRVIILSTSARGCSVGRRLRRISDAHLIEVDAHASAGPSGPEADLVTVAWRAADLGEHLRAMLGPTGQPDGARHGPGAAAPVDQLAGRHVFGPLSIDIARREVCVADTEIRLTRIQFDILAVLALHCGEVVSRYQLLTTVWGPHGTGSTGLLDVHIGQLRKRLGDDSSRPMLVVTVRGRGFRLAAEGWCAR